MISFNLALLLKLIDLVAFVVLLPFLFSRRRVGTLSSVKENLMLSFISSSFSLTNSQKPSISLIGKKNKENIH